MTAHIWSGPLMSCHAPGLIVAHMRSGPLKAYHVLGQITAQIRSGPLRGFGLNYDPYQIRPVNWTLCIWAHLLKAHLVIRPDISFGLLRARLTCRPYINFGLLKARHIVGPNYGPVCIRPAHNRYLIRPNKDQDNFGMLKARDLIRTIKWPGFISHVSGPTYIVIAWRPDYVP